MCSTPDGGGRHGAGEGHPCVRRGTRPGAARAGQHSRRRAAPARRRRRRHRGRGARRRCVVPRPDPGGSGGPRLPVGQHREPPRHREPRLRNARADGVRLRRRRAGGRPRGRGRHRRGHALARVSMFLDYTPEQQALRDEVRRYFSQLLTPDVRARLAEGEPGEGGVAYREVVARIGADGWLGVGWPKEYGGQGRPATDQFILFDEIQRAGAPFPFVTINTVGPTILAFGSDEQKAFFLPRILRGDLHFAIGYTEPEAGTDLASLRTRAVRDGDEYVVNGNKVFTSGANFADYIWLACRTDADAPKHKGISILLVPTSSPGFKATPITTVGGVQTTATFYDDLRVPVANRVGAENEGWRMITTQLNHERVGLAAIGGLAHRLWDDVLAWTRETESGAGDGSHMVDLPWVQMDLARTHARLEAMKLLN